MAAVTRDRRRREGGQALVVLVAAVIPALLMVGLIVDGGNAWSQQRLTQNAADAAADAGATILAKRDLSPQAPCTTDACWDAKVVTALTEAGQDKGVDILFCGAVGAECSYYTDLLGTQALGPVGTGVIPAGTAGVRAFGQHPFGTYFARIAGIDSYTATADAIAVFGNAGCPIGGGNGGNVPCSPLAFYVNWIGCDKSGKSVVQQPPTDVSGYLYHMVALPICKQTGNWGWLNPVDVATKTIPDWFDSNTGYRDVRIADLAAIASTTDPPTILIPLYDCANFAPSCPDPSDASNAQRLTDMGGKCDGTNCWYHIVKIGAFELHAVYQNNLAICGGQGSTDCLYGQFIAFISSGSIDQSQLGKGGTRAVQLIK